MLYNLRGSNSGTFFGREGDSYLQEFHGFERWPNNASRLKEGGKLSCGWKLAEIVMRRFAALLRASNGPGTLLPWRLCCRQMLRKNRLMASDRTSSGTQMCCGAGDWSDCTARWQVMGGRRIKRNAGHERFAIPATASSVARCSSLGSVSVRSRVQIRSPNCSLAESLPSTIVRMEPMLPSP